ncbi:MAG: hypothetical protein PHO46_04265 [Thermoguttaceae bacterium]|nr:hypothetical protein [Thermoguttaceae bacterium]
MIIGTKPSAPHVTVRGSDADPLPNLATTDAVRLFNVQSGSINAFNLKLKNTLARANPSDTSSTKGKGGALYIASGASYYAYGGEYSYNYALSAGGAVYVEENGYFGGSNLNFHHNQSFRGGVIANYGDVSISGVNTFANNTAGALSANMTSNSFGGAIYNAGTMEIGLENYAPDVTTFSENTAVSVQPASGAHLQGGSGGAIYNTSRTGKTVSLSVYNAAFNGNTASKYGGAISNFGDLDVQNTTFYNNRAAAGGALQTSGTATITGSSFTKNVANVGENRLTANPRDGDYGGNGAAIFASGSDSSLTIVGAVSFTENDAKNAGGAIDYINGSLTFNNATVAFKKNKATVIGGAVVAAKPIAFVGSSFTFGQNTDANTTGYYAPNVAVTCNVRDDDIGNIANAFFATSAPTRDKLDTFVRYAVSTSEHKLTFAALAESFTEVPTNLYVKVDSNPYGLWNNVTSYNLSVGSHTVFYYSSDNPDVVFRSHIQVLDETTSVVFSQIDLGERTYISSNSLAAGVSLRIYSTAANPIPVGSWTINWDTEGGTQTQTIPRFGFTLNTYHPYDNAGKYKVSLTTTDSSGGNFKDYGYVGECVVKAPASAAVLQEEIFADEELLDELFVEF